MKFPPIAIVGQACILPGATAPDELTQLIRERRTTFRRVPTGRWDVAPEVICDAEGRLGSVATDIGSYVTGPSDSASGSREGSRAADGLDAGFHWTLQTAQQVLQQVRGPELRSSTSLILGNLSYPSAEFVRLATRYWMSASDWPPAAGPNPSPWNRFHSSQLAAHTARHLGLGGDAYCLDAACASSLYAIKLACDQLHTGRADLVLTGGISASEDLFIHVGFTAIKALSASGQCRPFAKDADGLIPGEGCVLFALKRLDDAVQHGDEIHGVIRGVGLSNDGTPGGLLSPDSRGQVRAMRQAYRQAGVSPSEIGFVECHATGTQVGDGVELKSLSAVFEGDHRPAIGSLKSNLGHLLTAAGGAGLMKVLGSFRTDELLPGADCGSIREDAARAGFEVLQATRSWPADSARRAAVSAFGFGGCNAHLIVERWDGSRASRFNVDSDSSFTTVSKPVESVTDEVGADSDDVCRTPLAIVSIAAQVADGRDVHDLIAGLFGEARADSSPKPATSIALDARGLRFPPEDLKRTLPQQSLILRTALDAAAHVDLPTETTGVLVGMQVDPNVPSCGLRTRLQLFRDECGEDPTEELQRATPEVDAAVVVGTMPNIPANRINVQLDLHGPGLTVSADELSGVRALQIATTMINNGELDAAIVGAVDLCCHPVHAQVITELSDVSGPPGDAAVALVLKREADAIRNGDSILALVDPFIPPQQNQPTGPLATLSSTIRSRFGQAHAAQGLLEIAAATLAIHSQAVPDNGLWPWLAVDQSRQTQLRIAGLSGQQACVELRQHTPQHPPRLALELRDDQQLVSSRQTTSRLSTASATPEAHDSRRSPDQKQPGEIAWVFGSAAAAYHGMGKELIWAFPELWDELCQLHPAVQTAAPWLTPGHVASPWTPMQQLQGSSLLCQFHALLARSILHLEPDAYLGVSSGESNALFASGAWSKLGTLLDRLTQTQLFDRWIGGRFEAIRRAWKLTEDMEVDWTSFRVRAARERVEQLVADQQRVHLTMICSPRDVIISGQAAACRAVLRQLGTVESVESDYRLAVHVPEVDQVRQLWKEIHTLPTRLPEQGRLYGHGPGGVWQPDSEAAAEALLQQATHPLDFPQLVEQAWQDGVRVFVELGPRNLCTQWIDEILGNREHVCVAFDQGGRNSLTQLLEAADQLQAAGVPVPVDELRARVQHSLSLPQRSSPSRSVISFPAHWPDVRLAPPTSNDAAEDLRMPAATDDSAQVMPAAPLLPIRDDGGASFSLLQPIHTALGNSSSASPPTSLVSAQPMPAAQQADGTIPHRNDPRLLTLTHVTRSHQEFLQQMEAAHIQFLELRRQLSSLGSGRPVASSLHPPETAQSQVGSVAQRIQTHADASQQIRPTPPLTTGIERRNSSAIQRPLETLPPTVPHAESSPHQSADDGPGDSAGVLWPLATPRGPQFTREELLTHSSGQISTIFGPLFEQQDGFRRQVRMPQPPWLLADRVVGLDAEPGVLGRGTVWTETDLSWDNWFVHHGIMSGGTMIEAGQADLFLISWMGADFLNRDQRVYRLLGCELTYYGPPPRPGDTLRYQIEIDGHARQGDVRLFFFHSDCWVDGDLRLTVRQGQAGFFSDVELRESMGVLWDPQDDTPVGDSAGDAPPHPVTERSFSEQQLSQFYQGDLRASFGESFRMAATQVRPPSLASPQHQLLDKVDELDFQGGVWGRGYLRATTRVREERCGFAGHFLNDNCMPGTLVFDGCLQAMAFYMTAAGVTLDRDGWRFEPVRELTYHMICRGQIMPDSRELTYEIFVHSFEAGPEPTLYADMLCSVDGIKSFHCRRMGLRLVPDWPLNSRPDLLQAAAQPHDFASIGDVYGDYRSLLACAWGRPSESFGQMYAPFDSDRRAPRLPGPPYHFMSRISEMHGHPGQIDTGAWILAEYDVPDEAWYFEHAGGPGMPFGVLLEVNLQPCGWLASFTGIAAHSPIDLRFRNLDGEGVVHRDVLPGSGTLRTRVTLTGCSQFGQTAIVQFRTECRQGRDLICEFETSFGFFTAQALVDQVGVPTVDEDRLRLLEPCEQHWELAEPRFQPAPGSMLQMMERVTGYWPEGGSAGLGRIRAEQTIDPANWYFQAHFFQDPVQPGSLGLQAMLSVLQNYLLQSGLLDTMAHPRFDSVNPGDTLQWKYRGQVIPTNTTVTVELEILELAVESSGVRAVAQGWLWADGLRIYHAPRLGLRVTPGTD